MTAAPAADTRAAAPSAVRQVPLADTTVFAGRALGSSLTLLVHLPRCARPGPAQGLENRAWDAVLAEFAAVDRSLSRFRADSELTALNRLAGGGGVAMVSRRLRTMLAAVDRAQRITDGRFDGSVIDVLEQIGERGAPISGRLALAGHGCIELVSPTTPGASLVQVPDAPIDSGGIGKGLALRWAAAAAVRAVPGAGILVNAGGDIVTAGPPPGGGWPVGVDDPIAPPGMAAPPLAVYGLVEGGISTSSVAVRNWIAPDGRHVHHLVDPARREPARTGLIAVSVAGPDPAWNEVWSKALFLGGAETIGEEARRRGFAAWWVDDRGRLGMTPEARVRSAWIAEDRVG